MSRCWLAGALTVWFAACGDNTAPQPRPLVPDPAVELGCMPGPVAPGTTRAKPVACAEELIPGHLAGGRIGDILIENERVRVIVRARGEGLFLHGSSGGGIVDAAVVGGEDLIKEVEPAVELAVGAFDEIVITEAGDDAPAEVIVRGPATSLDLLVAALGREAPAVVIEHHYRLAAGAAAVELATRVFAAPGTTLDEPPTLYDAVFGGGHVHAFVPGHGFVTGNTGGDVIASAGTTSSYGLVYPSDEPDPQLIDLGGIRLIAGPGLDIESKPTRRWFVIGDGSVASVTETAWSLRGTELGTVTGTTAPSMDVVISDAAGTPVTVARADSTGAFRAAVPPGTYVLHSEHLGFTPGADVAITITAHASATATVPAGAAGVLAISVEDDDLSIPLPARVVIEPAAGDRRIEWVGSTGQAAVVVPPGTYRVSISRGLEYDAFVAQSVTVADGATVPVAARLSHVVDTAGWISLDTHLHSEMSTDSTFPLDDRLRAVAAEGVEVPVSSDHDFIVSYTPVVAELDLGAWLSPLTGEEASSLGWGHLNAWPLAVDAARAGGGAPRWLGHSPGEMFTALRGGDPRRIVQVNHPRWGNSSLFDAIDLDPATLTAHRDPEYLGLPPETNLSDLGFDAVEVANGLADEDFEQVFGDWLALVGAGHPAAATGSSDSHGPSAYSGEARTFVWVGPGADDPRSVDPLAIDDAIRARHVVIGTGAFVTAGIVGTSGTSLPGDTVDVSSATPVTLHVRVQAPPWQPLDRIAIYEGTHVARVIPLDHADTATVRYDADVALPAPTANTFWVVRVDPAGPGDPVLSKPMPAFTNPLFARVVP